MHVDRGACYSCDGTGKLVIEELKLRAQIRREKEKANRAYMLHQQEVEYQNEKQTFDDMLIRLGMTKQEYVANYNAKCAKAEEEAMRWVLVEEVSMSGVKGIQIDSQYGKSWMFKVPGKTQYCSVSVAKDFSKREAYYAGKGATYTAYHQLQLDGEKVEYPIWEFSNLIKDYIFGD
jgi:sulfur carrier protein ThiS